MSETSNSLISKCPHCGTSFRVSEAHLKSAQGTVRCGSCLGIFNAREHLISNGKESEQSTSAPKTVSVPQSEAIAKNEDAQLFEPSPSQTVSSQTVPSQTFSSPTMEPSSKNISGNRSLASDALANSHDDHGRLDTADEDLLISDDMGKPEEETTFFEDINNSVHIEAARPVIETSLFEHAEKQNKTDDQSEAKHDDSWALDLLRENERDVNPSPKREAERYRKSAIIDDNPFIKKEEPEEENKYDTIDFEAVDTGNDLPHEREEEDVHERYFTQEFSSIDEQDLYEQDKQDDREDEIIGDEAYRGGGYTDDNYDLDSGFASSHSSTDFVEHIEPEPVEFTWKSRNTFFDSNTLWWLLSIVFGLLLLAQAAIFNFDKLSKIQPYRQYYQYICEWFTCELPELNNPKAISATNLIVRSHARLKGVLTVDAVLQNRAKHEQDFPPLDLVFSDINGKPLTAKRIYPQEYLAGELKGITKMPARQPIKISINLHDPGNDAKGYTLHIAN